MLDYFDLADSLNRTRILFTLSPDLWRAFSFNNIDLNAVSWSECKFLNDDGTGLNDEMNSLPKNIGGIYLFCVKSNVIPGISDYLMYIGKAETTNRNSLNVRCKKYYQEYRRIDRRAKIGRLIDVWGEYLYLKYIELDDNEMIVRLEKALINALLPPINDYIPDKRIRQAKKAFD